MIESNPEEQVMDSFKSDLKILIVEDDKVSRIVLSELLSRSGLQVTAASTGEEAIKIVDKGYDMIFMDYSLPGIDGLETTKRIREEFANDIVIVGLTAYSKDYLSDMNWEIDDFLYKPVELNECKTIIMKYFRDRINSSINNNMSSPDHIIKIGEISGRDAIAYALWNSTGFDSEFIESIINDYIEASFEMIRTIKTSLLNEDHDSFNSTIHRLKGSSSSVRDDVVFNTCTLLEEKMESEKIEIQVIEQDVELIEKRLKSISS